MKYVNGSVRRQDRLMDEARALQLLATCEYGVLSMVTQAGGGYGVPLNYVWDGMKSLYIHCAPAGEKWQALEVHPQVSFCIIGHTNLLPEKFTTEYESVVLRGEAQLHLTDVERRKALSLLIQKLSPNDLIIGEKYIEKSFHRVQVIRIDISEFSGKAKYVR